jgi:hypothetical protein
MIARHIAGPAIGNGTRHAAELVPDRWPFAFGARRTFDLKGTGRYSPEEAGRKAPTQLDY